MRFVERRWSIWKTLLIFAVGIALVLLIADAIIMGSAHRGIEAELARIRARGEPVSCAELGGPPIPDEWNAALLYEKAFQMIKTPPMSNQVKFLDDLYSSVFCSTCRTSKQTVDKDKIEKTRSALKQLEGLFAVVEEASRKPACRFRIDWKSGPGALFPHYTNIREISRLAALGAILSAESNDPNSATRFIRLAVALEESIKDEPVLIGCLVRRAVLSITLSALRQVLETCDLTENQAKQLFDVLGQIDMWHAYKNAIVGERAFGLWCFDAARSDPGGIGSLFGGSGGTNKPLSVATNTVYRLFAGSRDELSYLSFMRRQIELADLSYREIKRKRIRMPDENDVPRYAFLTRMVAPIFGTRMMLFRDLSIAEIAVARAALAMEAYKARFGSYPNSIIELKKGLGLKLPLDPFSGSDLKLRLQKSGYVLYSIGPDLKDNNGTPFSRPGDYTSPGDIVWSKAR